MNGQEDAHQVAKDLGEDAERVLALSESFEANFVALSMKTSTLRKPWHPFLSWCEQ